MRLHKVKHDHRGLCWCGPAAVSALTGRGTAEIIAILKQVSGRRRIKGVYNGWIAKALQRLGYSMFLRNVYGANKPTLARWTREHPVTRRTKFLLIQVTGHYVVVHGRKLIDSRYKDGVFLGQAKGLRRKRVRKVFIVTEMESEARAATPGRRS